MNKAATIPELDLLFKCSPAQMSMSITFAAGDLAYCA